MDFAALVVLVLLHFDMVGWRIGFAFAFYLILKAVAFFGNIHSVIDGVIGLYMVLMLFGYTSILTLVAAVYLLQKAFFSII